MKHGTMLKRTVAGTLAIGASLLLSVVTLLPVHAADESRFKREGVNVNPLDNVTVAVTGYEIMDTDAIMPGEAFTLQITLKNTSYTEHAGNIHVTVRQQEGLVTPRYGSTNMGYLGYLEYQQQGVVSVYLKAAEVIDKDEVSAVVEVSHSDAYATHNSIQTAIRLPVSEAGAVQVVQMETEPDVVAQEPHRIGLTYANRGRAAVTDAVLHLEAEGLAITEYPLDTVSGGETKSMDLYPVFAEKGSCDVEWYLSWTDIYGAIHLSQTKHMRFTVSEPAAPAEQPAVPQTNRGVVRTVEYAILACGAAAGIILAVTQYRKRRYA